MIRALWRCWRRLAAALLLAAPTALLLPASTALADAAPGNITWAVTPADAEGADGRTIIEHTLTPGAQLEEHLAIRNLSAQAVTFRLSAADGFFTRAGRFDMLPSDRPSSGAGTWISMVETIDVAAGAIAVVPFRIAIPDDAEPGDHTAGVAASVFNVQNTAEGTAVGVESRVGFRVALRIAGALTPSAELTAASIGYEQAWNPFRPGGAVAILTLRNTGNTRLLLDGVLRLGSRTVVFPDLQERRQELLPGEERQIELRIDGVWPLIAVPAKLEITPTSFAMDGSTTAIHPLAAGLTLWAVPSPQLALLLLLSSFVGLVAVLRRRSRRRLAVLLDRARAEGRAEARQRP